jgi:Ala-tRNA(Pro) deacylase
MGMATRLKSYLDTSGVCYELVHHPRASSSLGSARAARVPGGRVAKGIVLEDGQGYLLALLPASCRLDLKEVRRRLRRPLQLASEAQLGLLFGDCEVGAVPAMARAYGLPALVDDSLLRMPDLYFEAGDHRDLVHLSGVAFRALLRDCEHAPIARPH